MVLSYRRRMRWGGKEKASLHGLDTPPCRAIATLTCHYPTIIPMSRMYRTVL